MHQLRNTRYYRFITWVSLNPGIGLVFFVVSWLTGALIFGMLDTYGVVDSLYWSMTTMSTVGYGDITPTNDLSKCFVMFFMAYSIILVVPIVISSILELLRPDTDKHTDEEQEWEQHTVHKIALAVNAEGVQPPPERNF